MKPGRIIFFFLIPFITAGLIGITGCMSSINKKYYQLYVPVETRGTGGIDAGPRINKVLMVQSVKVDEIYNDYRIVYRGSPYQLNYYSYNYWIKRPDLMVRDTLIDYFSRSRLFAGVIGEFSEGEPGLVLKATVYIMEEFDSPLYWSAHLKMGIEVKDYKTGERVTVYTFDRAKQLPKKEVRELPAGISQVMKEELEIFLALLDQKLATN